MSVKNYYEVLGISLGASKKQIRSAYLKLSLKHHPDKGGSKEKFHEIQEAYENLVSKETFSPSGKDFF